MLFRFENLDHTLDFLGECQRSFDQAFNRWSEQSGRAATHAGPWRLDQTDEAILVGLDLPGVVASDVELTLDDDALVIKGKRQVNRPEGYRVHMEERGPFEFTRKVRLPSAVDPERVKARLADGVLTVTLHKVESAQPVSIPIDTQ